MKLGTLDDGTRDGQLIVVARDLKTAVVADGIAPTLQRALDDWAFIAPQLDTLSRQLNDGKARRSFDFVPANCLAPLPRAFAWIAAQAYRDPAEPDGPARKDPRLAHGASSDLLGPCATIELASEADDIDFAAQLAVITDDVPPGATPDEAFQQIRLLSLANDFTLRQLPPGFQASPATAFAPVAVTPDELGDAWRDAKVHLALRVARNGRQVGQPDAARDMIGNFAQLVARAAAPRRLRAGTMIGTGPVTNRTGKKGYCTIAYQRDTEMAADGQAVTPFLAFGDSLRIEMLDADGKSVFGAIEQTVRPTGYVPPAPVVSSGKPE